MWFDGVLIRGGRDGGREGGVYIRRVENEEEWKMKKKQSICGAWGLLFVCVYAYIFLISIISAFSNVKLFV